jgi:hypothetical protein
MSMLSAVAALSPNAAWAVGVTYSSGDTLGPVDSLIEQWDGSAWHIVTSSGHSALYGLAAISSGDVWAVGGQFNYGLGTGGVTMHWDGTTWSVVSSVQPAGAKFVQLKGAEAVTPHDVWAVGQQTADPDHLPQPLIERWDGSAWHLVTGVPLPQSTPNGGVLNAVSHVPGTDQLWAVGGWTHSTITVPPQPLIERWDGTSWQIVASPTLPSGALGGIWNGVVALSATNAWAVGSYALANPIDSHPLIGHWDGTRWALVASPDAFGALDSVAAAGATDVRAAGSHLTGSGAAGGNGLRVPLIQQWNGTSWQIITSPDLGGATSGSLGIATDGSGNYWAAGTRFTAASVYQTLTLHCP